MTSTEFWDAFWNFGWGAAGGFLALSAAMFTKAGEALVGHVYDRKIEAFKTDLAALSDRAVRNNEREFEAITTIFEWVGDAYHATETIAQSFIQAPRWEALSEEDTLEFLRGAGLSEAAVARVQRATDKSVAYFSEVEGLQFYIGVRAVGKAQKALRRKGIFLSSDFEREVREFIQFLWRVQSSVRGRRRGLDIPMTDQVTFNETGQLMWDALRKRARVHLTRRETDP